MTKSKAKKKKKKVATKSTTGKQMLSKAVKNLNKPKQSGYSKMMNGTKNLSQRDAYAQAMNSAQRKGGSNGVGVGY